MPTEIAPLAQISQTYAYVARPFGGELRLTLCDGAQEHDDLGLDQSKVTNVIDSKKTGREADATSGPHPPPVLLLDDGRRTLKIPLTDITLVRLTYEPRNTLARGYRARLTVAGRRSVTFTSISWLSLVQTENRGESYRAFLAALLPAIAAANPSCRFRGGRPPVVWGLLVLCSIALIAGCVGVLWRAGAQAANATTLAVAAFTAAFAWVAFDLVKRNRPRDFDPAAPPADLLP